jgi:DNA-binding NtrC family response regulator
MRILIVDDDAIVLESCLRVLEPEGHVVEAVPSADEALSRLSGGPCDLLLVDVKMPVRDGFSLMSEVARRWPALPVIVMSGYPTEETIGQGMAMGAAAFVPKPFSPDELLETIRNIQVKENANGKP